MRKVPYLELWLAFRDSLRRLPYLLGLLEFLTIFITLVKFENMYIVYLILVDCQQTARQTVLILIRCWGLWFLIRVYTICSMAGCPNTQGKYGNPKFLIVTLICFQVVVENHQIEVSGRLGGQQLLISDGKVLGTSHGKNVIKDECMALQCTEP